MCRMLVLSPFGYAQDILLRRIVFGNSNGELRMENFDIDYLLLTIDYFILCKSCEIGKAVISQDISVVIGVYSY